MPSKEAQQYLCQVCKNKECNYVGTKHRHSFCIDFVK